LLTDARVHNVSDMLTLTLDDFKQTRERIAPHIKRTPLLTSRQLSEATWEGSWRKRF